jgi:hypothetical protein
MPDNRYRQIATDTDRQPARGVRLGSRALDGSLSDISQLCSGFTDHRWSRCTVRAQTTTRDNTGATE